MRWNKLLKEQLWNLYHLQEAHPSLFSVLLHVVWNDGTKKKTKKGFFENESKIPFSVANTQAAEIRQACSHLTRTTSKKICFRRSWFKKVSLCHCSTIKGIIFTNRSLNCSTHINRGIAIFNAVHYSASLVLTGESCIKKLLSHIKGIHFYAIVLASCLNFKNKTYLINSVLFINTFSQRDVFTWWWLHLIFIVLALTLLGLQYSDKERGVNLYLYMGLNILYSKPWYKQNYTGDLCTTVEIVHKRFDKIGALSYWLSSRFVIRRIKFYSCLIYTRAVERKEMRGWTSFTGKNDILADNH